LVFTAVPMEAADPGCVKKQPGPYAAVVVAPVAPVVVAPPVVAAPAVVVAPPVVCGAGFRWHPGFRHCVVL
jgi:hypothetical protein